MENSKIYDSFQNELQDYIRKQRARGLQPEVCFRKVTNDTLDREMGHAGHTPLMLEQRCSFRSFYSFASSYERLTTMESQLPTCSKIHHSRQNLGSLFYHQKRYNHFSKSPQHPHPSVQGKNTGPPAPPHSGNASCLLEDHPSVHWAGGEGQSQRRRSREEGVRRRPQKEQGEFKRKLLANGESHKENRKKTEVEPDNIDKPKHRKNNQLQCCTKRRPHREKKQPAEESVEERDLWDEAVLGSGCSFGDSKPPY